ncbi:HELZ-like protein [Mya arenaria]|uniref:HELZ-like protein n=1 Tax=Mya arenaria TaxID=6604 RepID=A0ABY7G6W0_MYAAR|nr:HELZ-like protein [Mya arenaria]
MSKKFEDNEQFRNWIKGVLGIDCLHDGLVEFVDKETERQWGINVQTIQNRCKLKSFDCKECTIVNLLPDHAGGSCLNKNPDECNCSKRRKKNKRKCPLNGACGIFYDMVIGEHVKKQPKWDNTKVENWRNNHWEYAKCFIPGHGHIDDDTSANTDTAALLSICLNNNDIRGLLGDPGTLEKSKSNRNELLHSGRMEITKEKLAEVLANMKAVLSTDAFSGYACARLAIDSIEKLERDEIKVTIQTDITARKTALKSIVSKKKEIENEIKDREDEVNKGIEGDRENKDSGEMSINDLYKETAKLTKAEEDHTTSISKHLNTLKDEVKAMQLSIQNHEDDLKAITEGLSSQSCLLKTMRQDQIEHGKELKDTHEDLKKVLVGIESLGKTNFVKEFPLPPSDDQSEGDGTSVNDSEKDYHEKNGAKTDNYSSETSHSEIEDLADDEEIATLEDTCNVQESSEFQSETEEGIPDATEHQYELGSVTIDRTEETDYRDEISVLQKGSVNQLSPTTCPLPSCNDDMLEDVACETITTVESESDDESFAAKDPRTDNAHVLDYKAKGIESLTETHDYSKAVDEELKTDPCLSQYATEVDERAKGLITGFTESPCNQNGTIKDSLAAAHCLPYHESDEVDVEDNTNESPPAIHESPTSALLPMREFVVDSQRKEMFGESSKTSVSEISTELACFTSTGIQPKNDVDTVDDQAEEAVMSLGNTFDNAQPQSEDQVEHQPSKEMIETEEVITSYSEFLSKTSDDQNHDGPGIPGDDDCVGGNSILTYSNESVAHDAGGDKDTGYDITALEYTPQTQRERECVLCGVRLSNIVEFKKHLRTKSHVENVRKDNDGRERWSCRSPPIGRKENYSLCPRNKNGTCPYGNQCTEPHSKKECEEWTERIGHRKRIIRFLSENLEKPDLENDISDMLSTNTMYALKRIRLVDLNYDVYFCIGKVHDISSGYICDTCDDMQEWTNPRYVQSYKHKFKYNIKIQFSADIYGSFQQKLNIEFGRKQVITKEFAVETLQETDIEEVKKEYKINESKRWSKDDVQVVPFKPIKRSDAKAEQELLQNYPLRDIMSDNFSKDLTPSPTKDNYKPWMHMMLYVEEHERLKQISKYNMITTLKLDDGLPPLTSTDGYKYAEPGHLFARIQFKEKLSLESQAGRLILQNTNTVWLSPTSLNSSEEEKKVYETKLEYREADNIDVELSEQTSKKSYSQLKQCNDNQWDAVAKCESPTQQKSPPLLIVGPFGTGKTYTIAQCTKHVLRTPGNRVLICTHSNSEADIYIRDYFQHIYQEGNVEAKPLRIYYQERRIETVSADVQKFCLLQTDEMSARVRFRAPNEKDIEDHRVIVTTMGSSKLLTRLKLKRGYFTHIFLDEAAQVLESETLIPLSLSGTYTRVVLAGDHMQMSPELFSKFAKQEQFSTSLLERLYNKYPKGSPYTIMLCKNYRTNQHIIEFMSRTLYDNKVVAEKNPPQHPQFYPLTFYTAMGREVCNGIKQGYYNQAEISEVTDHVRFIQATWPKEWGEFDEKSICVVAPYFMQIALLRHQLRSVGLAGVTVERVGNVQGKQYRVMIISTVRTKLPKDVEDEEDVDLGFLSNIKLINTAITRAQSLVIAVGDPVALCTISKCSFIRECNEHNSLHGLTFDTIQRLCQQSPHSLNPDAEEFYPLNDPFESTRSGAFGTVQRIRTRNNSIEENWKTYRSNPSAPSKAKSEQYCKCSVVTPTTTESAFHTAYVVNARPLSVVNPDMKDGNTNNNFNGGTGQLHNVHADMTPRQDQDGVKDNMQTLGHVTFSNEGNQVSQQTTPIVMQPQVQSSMSYTYFPIPTPVFNMKPPSALMNPAMIQKHSKHPYNPPPPNFSFPPNVSQSVSQPFFWNQNTPPQQGNFYGNNVMNMFAGANYGFMGANGPNAQQHFNPGYMGPNMYGGNTQTQVQSSENMPSKTNLKTGISAQGPCHENESFVYGPYFSENLEKLEQIGRQSPNTVSNMQHSSEGNTSRSQTEMPTSVKAAKSGYNDKKTPEESNFLHTYPNTQRHWQDIGDIERASYPRNQKGRKNGIHAAENAADVLCQNRQLSDQRDAQESNEFIAEGATYCTDSFSLLRKQTPSTISSEVDQIRNETKMSRSSSSTEVPFPVQTTAEIRAVDIMHFGNKKCVDASQEFDSNEKLKLSSSGKTHTPFEQMRKCSGTNTAFKRDPEVLPVKSYSEILQSRRYSPDEPESKDIERASYPRNQKGRKNGIHAAENAADVLCQNRQLSDQRDAQESNEFIAEGATYCTDSFSLLRKQTPSTISSEVDQIRNETKMSRSSSSTEVPFPVQTTAEIRAVDIMHFGNKKCVDASQENDSNEKLKLSSSGKTHTPFEQMRKCSGTNTAFKRDPEVLRVRSYSEILQSRRYSPDEPESKESQNSETGKKGIDAEVSFRPKYRQILKKVPKLPKPRLAKASQMEEKSLTGIEEHTTTASLLKSTIKPTLKKGPGRVYKETRQNLFSLAPANAIPSSTYEQDRSNTSKGKTNDKQNSMTSKGVAATCQPPMTKTRTNRRYSDCVTSLTKYAITQEKANCTGTEPPKGDLTIRTVIDNSQHNLQKRDDTERDANIKIEKNLSNYVQKSAGTPFIEIRRKRPKLKGSILDLSEELDVAVEQRTIIQRKCPPSWADIVRENHQ